MKYVLDTNTLSFVMGGEPSVCRRLLQEARVDVLLPQPVIAEIEYGLARLPESKKKARLKERFSALQEEIPRVLWTDEVSRVFGEIKTDLERTGTRIEDFDLAIAAHALALDAILVTDNLKHMSRIADLNTENWKETATDE